MRYLGKRLDVQSVTRESAPLSYDDYCRRLCQYLELFVRHRVNDDVHKQMRRVSLLQCFLVLASGG